MKLCYCDESGTGSEPIAVMVGVLVDAQRMHITKAEWATLLGRLSALVGKKLNELHTRDFYSGSGVWHAVKGPIRSVVISEIFKWLADRKHKIIYTSACKKDYLEMKELKRIPAELNTVWRFLGFHLALALQKYCQRESGIKGNTLLVFDNEEREQMRFTDVLQRPPGWSDEYYGRKKRKEALDQIVDVPYFGDSAEVALIQVADFVAFFLRRYAEIRDNLTPPRYPDEAGKIDGWTRTLSAISIGRSFMYPKVGRNPAEDLFYSIASKAIREI